MSNSRIFCIAGLLGAGLFSAFMNHVVHAPKGPENIPLTLMIACFVGALGVALLGDRK